MSHQLRLEALQARGRLPGVVARGDSPTASSPGPARPAWARSTQQYRIGSITKTMTAVAVLQLRDEGLLELDHPIGRYVPETGYAAATLRTLLSHTSGMQSEPVGSWWERSPGADFDTLRGAATTARARSPERGSTTTTPTSASRCSARPWPGSAARPGGRS